MRFIVVYVISSLHVFTWLFECHDLLFVSAQSHPSFFMLSQRYLLEAPQVQHASFA